MSTDFLTPDIIRQLRTHNGGTFALAMNSNYLSPSSLFLVDASGWTSEGYWVAVEDMYLVPDRYLDDSASQDLVRSAVNQLSHYDEFLGFWINEGIWHIDKVRHITTEQEATELAKAYNQLAIWDIAHNKEITL